MPIKNSAKKFMRVTDRKTEFNKSVKGVYRNAIKKTREFVRSGDIKSAQEWLKKSIKALDKATQKKVIKLNTASRYKSRLNKFVKDATLAKDNA